MAGLVESATSADPGFKEISHVAVGSLSGVLVTPLRRISHPQGDVLHGLKASDPAFQGFGEAYFSIVQSGAVKSWRKHLRMTLNLVVPVGAVRFVLVDDRGQSIQLATTTLDADNYARLTVPPGLWMAFQGQGDGLNLVLNVANLEHDPGESEAAPLDQFPYPWS